MKKILYLIGLLSTAFTFLGSIFKIMHWPGASVMIIIGAFSFAFIFIPLFQMFMTSARQTPILVTNSGYGRNCKRDESALWRFLLDNFSGMNSQRILIVDNDTVFRASLKVFFESHNYKVSEAESVKDAVKHDLMAFGAIVSDGESNTDIIRLARDIPVIITSSRASLRSAVAAMKRGSSSPSSAGVAAMR